MPNEPKLPDPLGGRSLHGVNPMSSNQPIEMPNEPKLQSANQNSFLENASRYWNAIGSKIGNVFQEVKSSGFNCFNSNPSPSSTSPPSHHQAQPSCDSNNGSFFTDTLESILNRVSVLLNKYVDVLN